MTTYYAFNGQFGCVGKFDHIPGALKMDQHINLGPVYNNRPPPTAFITDDVHLFFSELRRCGFGADWVRRHLVPASTGYGWYDGIDEETGALLKRDELA